jgi:pimeloyl-ACP methyl ester carboxylesterase
VESPLTPVVRRLRIGDIELSLREWPGDGTPVLLVHGLASNAKTWERVARRLSAAGHRVAAVDQRGHGLSDKPDTGYGFDEVTSDLRELIQEIDMERPLVAGQSWGGNVVLHFAARYPGAARGVALVDGGFIDLSSRPGATWETVSQQLRPPHLIGTPRDQMIERLRSFHPSWDEEQIEMQMGNFETLSDGTIRPWLTLDRHMEILRALWDQKPSQISERVDEPVLIATADAPDIERRKRRDEELARLLTRLRKAEARHFPGAAHDIHVDQPAELSSWVLDALARGFFD